MCLARPLKIMTIGKNGATGTVDVDGGSLTVGLNLVPDARTGDYVLVHAGMAIELLEAEDAQAILDAYEQFVFTDNQTIPGENTHAG